MTYLPMPDLDQGIFLVFSVLIIGAILGALICYILVRRQVRREYELAFKEWMADAEKRIRRDALGKSRAVLKGKIAEQLAPLLPGFDYNPADARFIGSPIDYIIFDGYSEAMEGNGKIRRIVLMDVKTGKARLSRTEKKVKSAVTSGAVEWETLVLDDV